MLLVKHGVIVTDFPCVSTVELAWVPVEEYAFFVLQTLLSGLFLLAPESRARTPAPLQEVGTGPGVLRRPGYLCGTKLVGSRLFLRIVNRTQTSVISIIGVLTSAGRTTAQPGNPPPGLL